MNIKHSHNNFTKAIEMILDSSSFEYKDVFNHQSDGCAMGAPISLSIAQIVIEVLEESKLQNLIFPTPFFNRYICRSLP